MSSLFNDKYYNEADPVKPVFESDESGEEDFLNKVMEKLEQEEVEPANKEDEAAAPNIVWCLYHILYLSVCLSLSLSISLSLSLSLQMLSNCF